VRKLVLVVAVSIVATVGASGAAARVERSANGDWIAYATSPADHQSPTGQSGSDVFIVQPGGTPKLVAGRADGRIWNVCPAFSPNGRLLAFGQKSPRGPSIRIVGVVRDGTIINRQMVRTGSKVPANGPCPKWSTDGKRIAYLDRNRKLVVMTIDGTTRPRRVGDPALKDFSRDDTTLVSPDGALVARRVRLPDCVAVSRRDGSGRRAVDNRNPWCSYSTAAWSPDSRTLLLMVDTSGIHFSMIAVPVNAPNKAAPVVVGVEVNHRRHQHAGTTWPGYGDVSWQPKP
jgi:Tol biopolymer transport system component